MTWYLSIRHPKKSTKKKILETKNSAIWKDILYQLAQLNQFLYTNNKHTEKEIMHRKIKVNNKQVGLHELKNPA